MGVTCVGGGGICGRLGGGCAPTVAMAENAKPVQAEVLVILAGTNDVANDVPFHRTAENVARVVQRVGVSKVVVSAIPPLDFEPETPARFNSEVKTYAVAQGWTFVDPMAGVREGDRFAPGMTTDGVHPTEAAARAIGTALGTAIVG